MFATIQPHTSDILQAEVTPMLASEEDYSPEPSLAAQQHRISSGIAAGQPITQAAGSENLHRNTVGYWRRTNPAFARELEFATREQRQYRHEQATALAPKAIEVLNDTLTNHDSSPSLRFRAAATILKMVTDPGSTALKGFPTLPAELEAMEGQMRHWQKEMKGESATDSETASFVQPINSVKPAQNCTMNSAQTIRRAPEPGRNSQ